MLYHRTVPDQVSGSVVCGPTLILKKTFLELVGYSITKRYCRKIWICQCCPPPPRAYMFFLTETTEARMYVWLVNYGTSLVVPDTLYQQISHQSPTSKRHSPGFLRRAVCMHVAISMKKIPLWFLRIVDNNYLVKPPAHAHTEDQSRHACVCVCVCVCDVVIKGLIT